MATNTIILKLLVDDGQLKDVTAGIDKQSKAIDRQTKTKTRGTKASNRFNKAEKGLYQTNLSGSKAFSKMNQTMGGSSGLVAAYATLAANVFAATAAFGALQRAAQFSQLKKGLTELGQQSGRTLSIMAEGLREVTGGAISAEEAMRAAALGVSGGFGGEQLAKLAKIARGASITLGRSLPDAFDRLTRGAIKLEPEILDELGIMVRLDDAVENYAAEIGKAGGALTQMERRQAFMNAIIDQGTSKFGEIADAVEPDAYSRLGATFSDLTNTIFNFFNQNFVFGFFGLNEIVSVLADNTTLLFGVMLLFGSTIAGKMIPALGAGAQAAHKQAEKFAFLAAEAEGAKIAEQTFRMSMLASGGATSTTYNNLAAGLAKSKDKMGDLNKMQKSLNGSVGYYTAQLKSADAAKRAEATTTLAALEVEQGLLTTNIALQQGKASATLLAANAQALANFHTETAIIITSVLNKELTFGAAWAAIGAQTNIYTKALMKNLAAQKLTGKFTRWYAIKLVGLKTVMKATGKRARLMAAQFLYFLPIIAGVILVVGAFWAIWNWKNNTKAQKKYNQGLEDLNTLTGELPAKVAKWNKALKNTTNIADGQLRSFEIQSGIITEINDKLRETIKLRVLADEGTGRDEKLGMSRILAAGTEVGTERATNMARRMGFGPEYFDTLVDAEDALYKMLRIRDSAEFKTAAEIMKNGIPSQAAALKKKITAIWDDDTIVGQEATLKAIQKAIGEIDSAYGSLGPSAKELRDSLKETEKEGAKFLSTFARKTSVDMFAKSTTTAVKSIKSLTLSVKEANAEEAGMSLNEVIGKALMDVGTKTALMIGPAFIEAQDTVRDLTNELDILTKKGIEPGEKAFDDVQIKLTEAAEELGLMAPLVLKLNKAVLKTQRLELTRKTTLEGINKLIKFGAKNYKQIAQLAGLENKMLQKKLKFEKEILDAKIAQLKTTFEEIKVTKDGVETTYYLNEFLNMSLQEQQDIVANSVLTHDHLAALLGSQLQTGLKQIEIEKARAKQSLSAEKQLIEHGQERLKLRKQLLDLEDQSEALAAKKQAYLDRGTSVLLASDEADIKIRAAETAHKFAKDSMDAELRLARIKGKMQLIDISHLNKEIDLYNKETAARMKVDPTAFAMGTSFIEQVDMKEAAADIKEMVDLQEQIIRKKVDNLADAVTVALIQGVEAFREDLKARKLGLGEAMIGTSNLQDKLAGKFTKEEMSMFGHAKMQADDTKRLADAGTTKGTLHTEDAGLGLLVSESLEQKRHLSLIKTLNKNTEDMNEELAPDSTVLEKLIDEKDKKRLDERFGDQAEKLLERAKIGSYAQEHGPTEEARAEMDARAKAEMDAKNKLITVPGPEPEKEVVPDIAEKAFNYVNAMDNMTLASINFQNVIKEFGPEGEAYGAMMEGMLGDEGLVVSLHGFSGVMDGAKNNAQKAVAVMSQMGQTVGALGSIMAANSKQQIAAIDNQIEAEKARDGSSKQSLAKIKTMEAKKLAIQKKAFETKKQMAIAETMISVVSAVVQAWDDYGWPWGAVLGAMIAAMGMKQISIIKSQQFTGGVAAEAGGPPPSISIGKRTNKVDVSKQASAGELAFLRGARGIGQQSTDFVAQGGAAGMRKGYASGGEILVGERGPETITPLTGLNVVPADQGIKSQINANFTIHAIDAAGVEEVLLGQQGNIINMIRAAANDYGTDFLEEVDIDTYNEDVTGGYGGG